MTTEELKKSIVNWNIEEFQELIATGADPNAVLHPSAGVYYDSFDVNGHPITKFIDYTILTYAIDQGPSEIIRILVNAGANFQIRYPYYVGGNLLDRVMCIPDEAVFCVPEAVEKAIFLISLGLTPITTIRPPTHKNMLPDFVEIVSRCSIHDEKTFQLLRPCKSRNYFESGSLKELCDPILKLEELDQQKQIEKISECTNFSGDLCNIVSSYTKPLEYRKDLSSVRLFKAACQRQLSGGTDPGAIRDTTTQKAERRSSENGLIR